MDRFSELSFKMLKEAGWFPGRNVINSVELPKAFEVFPAAVEIIKEFGHLRVGQQGPGIECARSTIMFEPMLAAFEDDRFAEWSQLLQSKLYPLGEVDNGHSFLGIDEKGRTFLVMDSLMFVDDNFDRGLDKLLTGVRVQLVDEDRDYFL